MLFFWMPHEDAIAIQSKWVDGGFLAPGFWADIVQRWRGRWRGRGFP